MGTERSQTLSLVPTFPCELPLAPGVAHSKLETSWRSDVNRSRCCLLDALSQRLPAEVVDVLV